MRGSINFDGWEEYPVNMSSACHEYDLESCHRRLQQDSKRLFSLNNTDICIETVVFEDAQGPSSPDVLKDFLTDSGDIEKVLRKHLAIDGEHFIFLRQAHTWAPLQLPEATLRKIFTAVEVNPAFLDIVHTFGNPKGGLQSRGCGGYDMYFKYPGVDGMDFDFTSEFFYKLRYIAKTGRESWPWSERTMGVYHKYDQKTKSSIWIIIQPTVIARKLPAMLCSSAARSFSDLHRPLFRATSQSWKAYLEHLELDIQNDNRQACLDTSMELPKTGPNFQLAFSNVQRLQHKCELIRDAISVFDSNIDILHGLESREKKMMRNCTSSSSEVCLSLFKMLRRWANDTMDSAKQTGDLTAALLNTTNSHALTSNTASLNLVAAASKQDAEVMLALTKAARQDSRTVKLVTVLAFIYLPGTFVATVFSTGFVTASLNDHEISGMHQSTFQGITYMSVTLALTAITLLFSYLWDRKAKIREEVETSKLHYFKSIR